MDQMRSYGTIKNFHTKNTQEGRGRELGPTGKEGVSME
jgi:hypothetical protein